MNGQTKRQNQTMEQYLRSFCNYEQGQLGSIVITGGVCSQQLHPPFHTDDTLLGELQLPSYNAV